MDIGQVVVKLNGRYAGYYGFVKEKLDEKFVIIGIPMSTSFVKYKKSNIKHVLPIPQKKIDPSIIENSEKVVDAFKKMGIEVGKRVRID